MDLCVWVQIDTLPTEVPRGGVDPEETTPIPNRLGTRPLTSSPILHVLPLHIPQPSPAIQ